jgi:hypothetical protein
MSTYFSEAALVNFANVGDPQYAALAEYTLAVRRELENCRRRALIKDKLIETTDRQVRSLEVEIFRLKQQLAEKVSR